ncbi:hypothetical protein KIW84_072421 [Lathyrus oleraceus]|uniref:BZIP domain-containing protein n=1 Tax=Pisum sativum TaxID=3888 RepID=A0A9D4VMZ1_PEA|nr:hypothetical protein KIW84_072421 [Pisum sativum]
MDEILKNIYPAAIEAAKKHQQQKQEQQEYHEQEQPQHLPHFLFNNTVDDVWTDIIAGPGPSTTPSYHQYQYQYQQQYQQQYQHQHQYQHPSSDEGFSACTGGDDVTLEDFLVKAGALPYPHLRQYSSSSDPSHSLDVAAVGKRKAVEETVELDKAALQKQKRMIKNRESAARSRERKQAYTNELERVVKQLETENKQLIEEEEERKKERLKQVCISTHFLTTERVGPSNYGAETKPETAEIEFNINIVNCLSEISRRDSRNFQLGV